MCGYIVKVIVGKVKKVYKSDKTTFMDAWDEAVALFGHAANITLINGTRSGLQK